MRPHISSDEAHRIAFGFSPPNDLYFATRLRDGLGEEGAARPAGQRAWQAADQVGFGTCRGERKANAARGLDDTGGDFQETKTQRCELGSGQFPDFGNGVAHGQHQPISGGVENEADLIGERRTATGAIEVIIPLPGTRRVKDLTKADTNKVLKGIRRARRGFPSRPRSCVEKLYASWDPRPRRA
jgi:hypothetical protein